MKKVFRVIATINGAYTYIDVRAKDAVEAKIRVLSRLSHKEVVIKSVNEKS